MKCRFGDKKRLILIVLIAVGCLPVAGAITAIIGLCAAYELKDHDARTKFTRHLQELERGGYIRVKSRNGKKQYVATNRGLRAHSHIQLQISDIPKQKKWDRTLRVVTSDIPVEMNSVRKQVAIKLKGLGFVRIQRSVFAHKYPCNDQVESIKQHYGLKDQLILFESSSDDLVRAYTKAVKSEKTTKTKGRVKTSNLTS